MQNYDILTDGGLSQTTKVETIVYNSKNEEIQRYDGAKEVFGKDFKDALPINYKIIKTTIEVLSSVTIEK